MKVFSQTSNEPYERHDYSLVLKSGEKMRFSDYESIREYWMNCNQIPEYLDYIIVEDKKNKKNKKKTGGFGFGSK